MDPSWTDVVQALASVGMLVAAVIGFWAVFVQLRQVRVSLESETHSKLYAEDFEWCKILLEKPQMCPYFRGSEISPDDPLYAQVDELAGLLCAHFEHILLQLENLPPHIRPRWLDYMRGIYNSSPITRDHLRRNRDWYSEKLISALE